MIRESLPCARIVGYAIMALLLTGCAQSRQIWPPFCQTQTLDGPGRLAGHHLVERDPWPLTTGTYHYFDYLGLDEQGRARLRTTTGDIRALGFIGGVGAGAANVASPRIAVGTGPQPIDEKICVEVLAITPDGLGGHAMSYRLSQRDADATCRPCPER